MWSAELLLDGNYAFCHHRSGKSIYKSWLRVSTSDSSRRYLSTLPPSWQSSIIAVAMPPRLYFLENSRESENPSMSQVISGAHRCNRARRGWINSCILCNPSGASIACVCRHVFILSPIAPSSPAGDGGLEVLQKSTKPGNCLATTSRKVRR